MRPLLREGVDAHVIINARNGRVLADHVMTAFDSRSRRTGLLHRDSMPEGSALVIAPSNAIHTFFMRFAIDVVFAAKDGRVLKTRSAMPAWRVAAALKAFAVVELPSGTLARADLKAGDELAIVRKG